MKAEIARHPPLRMIWTIGHSNREFAEFVQLLRPAEIEVVADVRRFPGSRKHPQFNQPPLRAGLSEHGIDYRHFAGLGGRRGKPRTDSPNTAWRVASFNAFADYMDTDEFRDSLHRLCEVAKERRTAIMCSEALPWRCHRRLIADALIVAGWKVFDIMAAGKIQSRELTPFARIEAAQLTYPGGVLFSSQAGDS